MRAIAVLAVMLFHFHAKALRGGFLGVDVFFVISGFVITASVAKRREPRPGRFLLHFYARRVKRLLPLLLACVLLTGLLGALVATPGSEVDIATWQTAQAALFGAGNLVLQARQMDYFASDASLNLFTHTWSLGVEEQFYLLYPLLLVASGLAAGASGAGRRLAIPLAALSLVSLIGWFVLNGHDGRLTHYAFPTRFWELAAGGLAFLGWRARPSIAWLAAPLPGGVLALMVLVLFLLPRALAPFTTVAVVVLVALLLMGLTPDQAAARLLSAPPLRWLGLRSYALYLWHWSVLSISAWTVGIHAWTAPVQVVLIVGLAHWSHHAIEEPLRRASWGGSAPRTLLLGLMGALTAAGAIHAISHPFRARLFTGDTRGTDPIPWQRRVAIANTSVTGAHCHNAPEVNNDDFAPYARRCTTARRPSDRQRLFVLGDSHALALLPLEDWLHTRLPLQITHYSRSGCPLPPSASQHAEPGCWIFSHQALASVLAAVQPGDSVLVHNYYRSHFGQGEDTRAMQVDGRGQRVRSAPAKVAYYQQALDSLANRLAAKQASLLLVEDVPRFLDLHVDHNLCVKQWFRPWLPAACRTPLRLSLASHRADHAALRQMFATLEATHANVHLFDPADALCPGGMCASHDALGNPFYRDRDHLNARGVLRLSAPLEGVLRRWSLGRRAMSTTKCALNWPASPRFSR